MAPPKVVYTTVSIVKEVSKQTEWGKSHWVIFNAGKNAMYLNPARHDLDSLVRFLAYLTQSSPLVNDNAAASSLKQAAQALSGLIAAPSTADGQPAGSAGGQLPASPAAVGDGLIMPPPPVAATVATKHPAPPLATLVVCPSRIDCAGGNELEAVIKRFEEHAPKSLALHTFTLARHCFRPCCEHRKRRGEVGLVVTQAPPKRRQCDNEKLKPTFSVLGLTATSKSWKCSCRKPRGCCSLAAKLHSSSWCSKSGQPTRCRSGVRCIKQGVAATQCIDVRAPPKEARQYCRNKRNVRRAGDAQTN